MTTNRPSSPGMTLLGIVITGYALLFMSSAHSQTHLSVETGLFWQHQNDIQIPRNNGTAFSFNELADGGSSTFVRFTLNTILYKQHDLRLIYAPLRLQLLGEMNRPLQFADDAIERGVVMGTWRLKSNRFTWRYRAVNKSRWSLKTGLTLMVRDREIRLEQNERQIRYAERRLLPLMHVGGQYLIYKRWQFGIDLDGMPSSRNGFYDLGLRLEYDDTRGKTYSLGYRLLDTTVNNGTGYTEARMHYITAGVRYRI